MIEVYIPKKLTKMNKYMAGLDEIMIEVTVYILKKLTKMNKYIAG